MKVLANYLVSVAPLCLLLVSAASRVDGSPSQPLQLQLQLPLQEAPSLRGGHSSVADLGLKAETADREEFRRRSLVDAKTDTKTGSSAKGADGTGGASGSSTATASSAASSAAAPETAASKTETDKGSIASRTATYSAKKESSLTIESPQAMGIKVVKPETAAPSPAPPKTTATTTTAATATATATSTTTTTTGSNAGNAGGTATVNPTASSGTTAPSVLSSKLLAFANSNSTASTSTDDVASLVVNDYDDDSLNYTVGNETAHSNNKPLAMPKEKAQPEEWPEVVAGVFVLGALVMMCATFVTNYRKRKNYESIPTTLTV